MKFKKCRQGHNLQDKQNRGDIEECKIDLSEKDKEVNAILHLNIFMGI